MTKHFLAADLGASSGRTIAGTLKRGKLLLQEVNRFRNGPVNIGGALHWDFGYLLHHVSEGIASARDEFGTGLVSMGVDTWGVDFGLVGPDGELLGNPGHYRDSRTVGMMEEVFARVPRSEVFARTGIQFMQLNSLYQLMALGLERSPEYRSASRLLFMPDLLNYRLTGSMACERTIASTSQFYNPVAGGWAFDLLEKLEIRTDLFADLVEQGTLVGDADGLPVVTVGSHDTASAFAAVPVAEGEQCAFLSSGTWSLLGTELAAPVINGDSLAANFTNEVGVCGTIRFLRNLSGLWIIQELRREWAEQGFDRSFEALGSLALEARPFEFFIDPGDEMFIAPGGMTDRIGNYCEHSGQGRPESRAQVLRAVYESLALLYAEAFEILEALTGRSFDTLRIVGGGSQDAVLNQMAADALGRPVRTGPVEATATGNLIVQMLAAGLIGDLAEGRMLVNASFAQEMQEYHPGDTSAWLDALDNWTGFCR